MLQLWATALVIATVSAKVSDGYLYSTTPNGEGPSAMYNLMTSPHISKYKNSPHSAPPDQQSGTSNSHMVYAGVPTLSGIALYSPRVMQKTVPYATALRTPAPIFVQPSTAVADTAISHIMTIPRKYAEHPSQEAITYTSPPLEKIYTSHPDNSIHPVPQSRQVNSHQAPLLMSCPATVFYPTQAIAYGQPSILGYSVPSTISNCPVHSPTQPQNLINIPLPVAVSDSFSSTVTPSPPSTKDTIVTYSLLNTNIPKEVMSAASTSLEAENKDCSIPVIPSLV